MNNMELTVYKGALMAHQRMGRLEGLLQVVVPETEHLPPIKWHGAKIPRRLWNRIKAFCLWSQQQFNSEAQIRLYYNDYTNRWRAVPFPQFIGTGLFSEEISEGKLYGNVGLADTVRALKAKLLKLIEQEKGWYEFGTVHHHCTAGAFQSGTDHKDEIERPGIHITLGNILSDVHSVHARCIKQKRMYDVDISEWIDGDMNQSLVCFPGYWTKQCFEKPKPVVQIPAWRRRDEDGPAATDNATWTASNYGRDYDYTDDGYAYDYKRYDSAYDRDRKEALMPNTVVIDTLHPDEEFIVLNTEYLYDELGRALCQYQENVIEQLDDLDYLDYKRQLESANREASDELRTDIARKASLNVIKALIEYAIDQMKDHAKEFSEWPDQIGASAMIESALVKIETGMELQYE